MFLSVRCTTIINKYRLVLLVCLLLCVHSRLAAQKQKADSLNLLLKTEQEDTIRVRLMWQMASAIGIYNPDSALKLSFKALSIARNIDYTEGESRSIGVLANTFLRIGNYPRALELNIEKLKLEEKRNKPRNMASVLMNIGVVYAMQEEYDKALEYYYQSDSLIQLHNIESIKYNIALNTGDAYDRLNLSDSSYHYFSKSLEIARKLEDIDLIGTSMTGLGHSYRKQGRFNESLVNYQDAIQLLGQAHDDEIFCEAALGLARLYNQMGSHDSTEYYANLSLNIARKDGFLTRELEAADFLTNHYESMKKIDSAFRYSNYVRGLNDSVNSKSKIRELQVISSNEQFRQLQLEEEKQMAAKKRFQQLQLLLIAIFIPGFFLVTLILSRVNVPIKLVRLLGILSLLFLFEYLTLLLHPFVAELTHHTPIYEILIFVVIASVLIPLHHRFEHWMIHHLLHVRLQGKKAIKQETSMEDK
ncbi:MAG TPA: tetratricopeptide repeat protein [Chitinophagaceae bacterium]|nr:tetratricopeptide repeat protein [Chitinophagaceae bacterium]